MLSIFLLLALAAQPPAPRAGVSVQMAVTQHAQPLPQADQPDAVVVALTRDGRLYNGITPISVAELPPVPAVYLKADARAPYAKVIEVLDTLHHHGVASVFLLTDQKDTPEPAYPVPPKGIELRLTPSPR